MTYEEIQRRVTEIFRDIFDRDSIVLSREMTSADIEDWDSLANISLIVAVEKEFGISFTLNEIKALSDVGNFLDLVQAKSVEL